MIRLENVTKVYPNGVKALDDVSFEIEKGAFVFIVGSSGSGKSTLLKLLMKEINPTSGKLHIEEKDITKLRRSKIPKLRRSIGVVFQDFRLLEKMTIYNNVAFTLKVTEAPTRTIRRNVPMVLSLVGLSQKANMHPKQLSGGEQQRAALARAIVNNPPILLADEPTGNLDPKTSWEIMKLLLDINLRGTTVVVVTHDKEVVNSMKKRVITLREGRVVRDMQKGDYGYEN
ncbi:cell-division signal transducer (ATP-binding protein) [Petrocella atlantisensis]|uniref:Cell division ATP-binding protein FtsE n=1 Tax=Petrocella atlantisensis TaxID=2173034 RepID=A0A3P7P9R3_9FIRM|nr:cell division ATP-binding protein FtsE [Petrocella atlantisensis]MCF8019579.1 cell division ATP-binding protein FtsE [Vallitaleaceae bacterium]PKM55265.1 MAG: cell division ATP-binding protein FtsE [Firmicutes bacterium HGW-Firmicutes-5]VDN46903.1 cell-division signal transducer (ATP-binding protein) [Petrocella atlantisensis]